MELVNNNTDLRVIKTHLAIEKAFFKLLEQEPYANITILRIVDEAMIGQTTFYHHYQDKTDLATRLIHAVLDKLSAFFQQPGNNSTLTEITIPQQAEYIELLHRVRLLRQINTPELSFEVCAVNYITKQIHCDLKRYELNLHYPKEVSTHLSALFYSLFMTLVDHHDDYDVSNLEVQFYESIKALTTLIAPPKMKLLLHIRLSHTSLALRLQKTF